MNKCALLAIFAVFFLSHATTMPGLTWKGCKNFIFDGFGSSVLSFSVDVNSNRGTSNWGVIEYPEFDTDFQTLFDVRNNSSKAGQSFNVDFDKLNNLKTSKRYLFFRRMLSQDLDLKHINGRAHAIVPINIIPIDFMVLSGVLFGGYVLYKKYASNQ